MCHAHLASLMGQDPAVPQPDRLASRSPTSAGSHSCHAVEECAVGVLRPVGRDSGRRAEALAPGLRSVKWLLRRVPLKTQQGPRLLSRGAPQFPSTIECRLDPC